MQQDGGPVCMICLEPGPDAPAPCQALKEEGPLAFHSGCLSMAWAAGQTRCPHCNEPVHLRPTEDFFLTLAVHRLVGTLQQWFQDRGSWKRKPRYLKAKDGLLTGEEDARVLARMREGVHACMSGLRCKGEAWHPSDETTWTYTCTDPDDGSAVTNTVCLTRTALVDSIGRFLQDGYTVAAQRQA